MAIAMSGVLEDNVISFEAPASILLIQGGQGYRTNQSGRFAVILPGGQAPVDYEFTVEPLSYKFMPDSEYKIIIIPSTPSTTVFPKSAGT